MPNSPERAVRDLADAHVSAIAELDPFQATWLGMRNDRMRDMSPAGQQAHDELSRRTLAALDVLEHDADGDLAGDERRCARLLRERLTVGLEVSESGEHLRSVQNIIGPLQSMRNVFTAMPTDTEDDWAMMARRMAKLPDATTGYIASLAEGARRGLFAAPRQVVTQ